jgi:uncharacterized membrane protein
MKKRHVFVAPTVPAAEAVVDAVRRQGVDSESIRLEARSDIEIRRIDDDNLNVSMDFIPAAWHGTLWGFVAGFAAGLIAMFIPGFGVSLGGAAALAVVGALVGTWASVLMGSALPDEVRRTFKNEIEAGRILVVVDAEPEKFVSVEAAIVEAGGVRLPFESTTALN